MNLSSHSIPREAREEMTRKDAEIAKLRAALDPERLANIIGPLWMGHPKEQDVLDETVRQIRDGIDC